MNKSLAKTLAEMKADEGLVIKDLKAMLETGEEGDKLVANALIKWRFASRKAVNALVKELAAIEQQQRVYLLDVNGAIENMSQEITADSVCYWAELYRHVIAFSAMMAENEGLNLNVLLGRIVY